MWTIPANCSALRSITIKKHLPRRHKGTKFSIFFVELSALCVFVVITLINFMHIRRIKFKFLKGIDGRPYIVSMYEHQEFF